MITNYFKKYLLESNNNNNRFIIDELNESFSLDSLIDKFYNLKMNSFVKNITDMHRSFINSEKSILDLIYNKKISRENLIDIHYGMLTTKYDMYSANIFDMVNDDMYQTMQFVFKNNKDVEYQRDLIYKFIEEKHVDIAESIFDIDDIYLCQYILPDYKDFISLINQEEDSHSWFMDKEKLKNRIQNNLILYNKYDKLPVKKIIEIYDKYIVDIKEYHHKYKNSIKELKIKLTEYITKLKEEYNEKTKKEKNENNKKIMFEKLKKKMNIYFSILDMLAFYYQNQMKIILESFKLFSKTIQKIYNYILIKYNV